ncbi:MAG: thrombospondin type 3 repeat-containing protein [Planctomycetota bacterium]
MHGNPGAALPDRRPAMMHSKPFLLFPVLAALGSLAWLGAAFQSAPLQARAGNLLPLADADADGLDDGLETLMGTLLNQADTDGDGLEDATEVLLGTDPLVPEAQVFQPSAALRTRTYILGKDVVVEVLVLFRKKLLNPSFFWGDTSQALQVPFRSIRSFFVDTRIRPLGGGWKTLVARFVFPRNWVNSDSAVALGFSAQSAGGLLFDSISLINLPTQVVEVRLPSTQGLTLGPSSGGGSHSRSGAGTGGAGGTGGGTQGGIFPVEPDPNEDHGQPDNVCVQVLVPTGSAGPGMVTYQVQNAFCDPLAGAVCVSGCTLAGMGGMIVVGIDILGLIGG